jgi:hypothetical protein
MDNKSIGTSYPRPLPVTNNDMFVKLGEKYLNTLENNTENTAQRTQLKRSSHEKQLFLFSTCFILGIPFSYLSKECDYFNFACFSCSDHGVWVLRIRGAHSLMVRFLPKRYVDCLFRYRAFLGLNEIPEQGELVPIFKSTYSIIHVLKSLPIFDFMSMTPRLLLKKLAGLSQKIEEGNDSSHTPLCHDASMTRGNADALRRTRRLKTTALKIYSEIDIDRGLLRCSSPPPPLCFFDRQTNQQVEMVEVYTIAARVFFYIHETTHADATTLVYFSLFANSISGKRSRLKIKAYEKLALWCIFVKGISIASLTEKDAKQFYAFCVNPPSGWRCNGNESRRFLDTRLFNHLWRPFKFLSEDVVAGSQRAGKIMEWCDAVQQELLSRGLINSNAFRSVSREWWSLKHH